MINESRKLEVKLTEMIDKQIAVSLILHRGLNDIANKFHNVPGILDEVEKIAVLLKEV